MREVKDESVRQIYLLRDGRPAAALVKTGAANESYVEISPYKALEAASEKAGSVAEGDTVITGIMPNRQR